ncbi:MULTISPECIES: hypothetical protein [Aeromonas]|uniref:hypothetical protein n=1 Tax=Aeromonas TaxID=642 RepID=UPI00051ACDA9|nr:MULTISPECIES: hypothetical protein [Aeromonas]MCH7371700.1 hypothetical protein [Aeromonas sp. MR16]
MTSLSLSARHFWRWLAYHHQAAEGSLYLMFFSGLLLWEPLTPFWSLARWNLFLHVMLSLSLFPLLFGAFWLSHRRLLRHSHKPFLRTTGQIIEALLLVCLGSGLVLVLHGTPGDRLGALASWAHWLSSLALTPLVLRHAWRWTILKWSS